MSSKIQMVRKEKPSSSAAEAAPVDQEQAGKIEEGVRGDSGPVDDPGPTGPSANYDPGPKGASGHDGITGEPVPSDPLKGEAKRPDLESGFWEIRPTPIEDIPVADQPAFYTGAQSSRRVAIARGIFAVEIQGVGVIIEGAFLPGFKLVDIMDLDRKVVVERAVRPLR